MKSLLKDLFDLEYRAEISKFSVKTLAQDCNISRRHLERLLLAMTGMSPGAWLRQKRLSLAKSLVAEGKQTKSVSLQCAYSTPSTFCRAFKEKFGCAPTQIKKQTTGPSSIWSLPNNPS
jgi:AraC-like DNA-binding protein